MEITYAFSADLKPSPFNANVVDEDNLAKLRESIKRIGHFKPVITRDVNGQTEVIGGWHRVLIAKETDEMVPTINLGEIDDDRAKQILLLDNTRNGENDPDLFADLLDSLSISVDELSEFVPGYLDQMLTDLDHDIDLNTLNIEEPVNKPKNQSVMSYTTLKFRVPSADAHMITDLVNEKISELNLDQNNSSIEAAGAALLWIFNNMVNQDEV